MPRRPFPVRDHLWYNLGILSGPGIICGTIWGSFEVRGSFAAPYKPKFCQESFFFTKRRNFSRIRYKIEQYFNSGHAHKPKFGLFFSFFFGINHSQFCLLPLSFLFFSALLLWPPFALHVLSGYREKLDGNYGRSLEMDLDQS